MIRVVVQNLAQNSVRYAEPGAHLSLILRHEDGGVAFIAADDGVEVAEDVPSSSSASTAGTGPGPRAGPSSVWRS